MRYLRYLGLGGYGTCSLPSSIGDILSLETLYAPNVGVFDIPGSLWKIPMLKHVHIPCCNRCSVSRQISSLSNIQAVVGFDGNNIPQNKRMMEAIEPQVSKNQNPGFSFCYIAWYNRWTEMEIAGRYRDLITMVSFPDIIRRSSMLKVLKICCINLLSNNQDILELNKSDIYVFEIYRCTNPTHLPEGLLLLPNLVKMELIVMPLGCHQQGIVVQELMEKGCVVSISSDKKNFQHLNLLLSDIDATIESALN